MLTERKIDASLSLLKGKCFFRRRNFSLNIELPTFKNLGTYVVVLVPFFPGTIFIKSTTLLWMPYYLKQLREMIWKASKASYPGEMSKQNP